MGTNRAKMLCRFGLVGIAFAVLTVAPGLTAAQAGVEDLFSGVTTIIAPYATHPAISVDGKITPGEYDKNVTYVASDTGISFWFFHDNDSLYVGIQGMTFSWVAIGLSSDSAATMGFVVVSLEGTEYVVHERLVTTVSEDMTFTTPHGDHEAVKEFESTFANTSVVELQLNLESSLWSLQPGVVYPTVVASNLSAGSGIPTGVSGSESHFVGSYLLRADDSVKNVNDLLNGKTSPVPSAVALGILVVGVVAIFAEFVVRRRKQ